MRPSVRGLSSRGDLSLGKIVRYGVIKKVIALLSREGSLPSSRSTTGHSGRGSGRVGSVVVVGREDRRRGARQRSSRILISLLSTECKRFVTMGTTVRIPMHGEELVKLGEKITITRPIYDLVIRRMATRCPKNPASVSAYLQHFAAPLPPTQRTASASSSWGKTSPVTGSTAGGRSWIAARISWPSLAERETG